MQRLKIGQKPLKLESENEALTDGQTFLHQSRAITLLFMNEFSPFAIPNHSSPISISMQRLKKIGQKLLKVESGNEALTDRWTDGRTDGQTARHPKFQNFRPLFCVAGYKNECDYLMT